MSISATDHRRFLEGKLQDSDKTEKVRPLLAQVAITGETGDQRLDKLMRAVTALKEKDDKHTAQVAEKGIGCVQEEMIRLQQFEFFYTKGRIDFANAVLAMPSQILFEEAGANVPEAVT